MPNRNAIVKIGIEKAQGLMLSISAATMTSGRSHFSSFDQLQSAVVPVLPALNKITDPTSSTLNPMSNKSLLVI